MSVVYLIAQPSVSRHSPGPRIESLREYGEVRTLVLSGEAPGNNPDATMNRIERRLSAFRYEQDYMVWAGGDHLAAVMAGWCLSELEVPYINWLRVDRPKDPVTGRRIDELAKYNVVRVTFFEPQKEG